jgi:transcriptional regulator with XRE-family HTH domain
MDRQIKFNEILSELVVDRGYDRARKIVADEIKVSVSSLSQYENGKSRPSFETLVALAEFFEVSIDYLVFGASRNESVSAEFAPAVRYMDRALAELQAKTDRQSRLFGVIADALYANLVKHSERLASQKISQGGIITDEELLVVERYSLRTSIISTDLSYDVSKDGSNDLAGPFLEVVAQNLQQGRSYRFLLPNDDDTDWRPVVKTYRAFIRKIVGRDDALKNCQFKETQANVIGGCGFYEIDVSSLEQSEPIKYARFQEWMKGNALGFVIAASRALQVNSLMDEMHLRRAVSSFDRLWKKSAPIPEL